MNSRFGDPVVLDTDVASFIFNDDPIRAPRYEDHLLGPVYLPFVTVAEMRYGARMRGWGPARWTALERFLARYLIVESAPDICDAWASIRAYTKSKGRSIAKEDAWVAAVAVTLGVPLVTHNAAHYIHVPSLQVVTEPDR